MTGFPVTSVHAMPESTTIDFLNRCLREEKEAEWIVLFTMKRLYEPL